MANELSERRTVTLAWLNTSMCKENLEVMTYEERYNVLSKWKECGKKRNMSMS